MPSFLPIEKVNHKAWLSFVEWHGGKWLVIIRFCLDILLHLTIHKYGCSIEDCALPRYIIDLWLCVFLRGLIFCQASIKYEPFNHIMSQQPTWLLHYTTLQIVSNVGNLKCLANVWLWQMFVTYLENVFPNVCHMCE